MARKDDQSPQDRNVTEARVSTPIEELLLAALARGDESFQTGRYIVTYKEDAVDAGIQALKAQGLRIADAREFQAQAFVLEDAGDADAAVFPEIRSAVIGGGGAASLPAVAAMSAGIAGGADSAIESIDPEYFVFPNVNGDYLRGFVRGAEAFATGLKEEEETDETDVEPEVLGATWGLLRCKVPTSIRSGNGIKVAVLDTGMDLGHPDFAGRTFVTQTFVGQPVQDLHSHGTHCIGTSCGPKAPAGNTPRYGIAFKAPIFVGKVLSNSGGGATGSVLAGMNWAIANRCVVISMSLGSQSPIQPAYTAAGQAALSKGCLIVAAAGNAASNTGSPANSPTIMSVASLDPTLSPSAFSNFGKIDIAAPGRDVFSSVPRPTRYGIKSGTSMATPHVAGCAALWAEASLLLRGLTLWRKLQATARALPFPATQVGSGLVQAP